jgi:6-pyruvoyltetrahydropterin/6-carboxytetrahydropterin synthase
MKMYIIRKEFTFSAGHHLIGLPKEHPCSRMHGHNYVIVVELRSTKLNEIGFVKDYRELDHIKKFIDDAFDHKYLNDFLEFNPTAENIAKFCYETWIKSTSYLYAVEVSETPKTNARYEPFFD